MSRQRHPDAEAIARYQAGLMSGSRGRRLAAHIAGCARCAAASDQLAAVGSVLASVPGTPMPDAVERRIAAALATTAALDGEAATRSAAGRGGGGSRRPRLPHRPRVHGFRLAMVVIPAVACLLLSGFVYLLSHMASSSSSNSMSSAASGASGHGAASAPSAPSAAGGAASGALRPLASPLAPFVVIQSGTAYHKGTLAAQVRGELDSNAGVSPGRIAGSQLAPRGTGSPPSQALVGCVLHLTGNTRPRLVDLATYQGERAYVIATADRVWVAGLGCTASHPALITSIALSPLPGISAP